MLHIQEEKLKKVMLLLQERESCQKSKFEGKLRHVDVSFKFSNFILLGTLNEEYSDNTGFDWHVSRSASTNPQGQP